MSEPTEQDINRRIAEWMGWEPIPEGHFHPDYPVGQIPPSFTTDHNAIAEVLGRMRPKQLRLVVDALALERAKAGDYIGLTNPETIGLCLIHCLTASAHDKALAIYRVLEGEK